jgi:DNA-binding NtrC family response regulator
MILVVDDDKILTQLLKNLLEDAGYEVRVANDGEAAYGHLKDPKCRAMLLDIRMPGINGAELLMLMTAEGIKVPVIVMAGFPDFDEEEMKQFPNVKKMFHKPLYPEDVLSAVREFARK